MDTKQLEEQLLKTRSFYLRLCGISLLVGFGLPIIASITGINILGSIGVLFLIAAAVFLVLAYKTGKKLINL